MASPGAWVGEQNPSGPSFFTVRSKRDDEAVR